MATTSQAIETELHQQFLQLPLEQQQQVLEFARTLAATRIRGVPGKDLLRFAGTIAADDLAVMKQAIEAGCEQVDQNEW